MKRLSLFFFILLVFVSCDKTDQENQSSRTLRYELTGTFTGSLVASYTTASGGTANETVTDLPWSKEITYAANVTAAVVAISGNGGSPGQQVAAEVKQGGTQVASTVATANSSGSFTEASAVVIF
ncbi:MAG: hypothetical protein J0G98_03855 [Terrimonas ferruginea]|uniref:hypothetical protein n=1 Tax=Terrimonas ferruginea TaxID=249 RepID=UPI000A5B1EBC|nr:hypothetical protein [Terrimonas ferruginea]MBN8782176.1 hypothetical protein [Terrimonas ferruginea]